MARARGWCEPPGGLAPGAGGSCGRQSGGWCRGEGGGWGIIKRGRRKTLKMEQRGGLCEHELRVILLVLFLQLRVTNIPTKVILGLEIRHFPLQ